MGTNNHGDTPEEIAEGLKAITDLIRDKQPQAFLVVLTLLPRGHFPNKLRERNAAVNALVAEQLKGNSRYVFEILVILFKNWILGTFFRAQLVNIDANFVQADGSISHHDMHDYLHLTQKGYDKAFEPVNDLLVQLLTESETDLVRTEAEGAADWNNFEDIVSETLFYATTMNLFFSIPKTLCTCGIYHFCFKKHTQILVLPIFWHLLYRAVYVDQISQIKEDN